MKTTELTDLQQMVALWKEKNISSVVMDFACGGDQMNDVEWHIYSNNEEIECEELESYFDNEVYNRVEFYVNSDGHYQGEAGSVTIELDEDGDEPDFTYSKSSESEWNESFSDVAWMDVTEAEAKFIQENIHSFVGGEDGEAINYKRDVILNDEQEELVNNLANKIQDYAETFEFENAEGEENGWWNYTTDVGEAEVEADVEYDESNPTIVKGGKLAIVINKSYTIWKEDNE